MKLSLALCVGVCTVALTAAVAPQMHGDSMLRFQGVQSQVGAPAPQPDPSTQVKGQPVRQKLNIGEKPDLSPAMKVVLSLVVLYYAISTLEYVIAAKKEWKGMLSAKSDEQSSSSNAGAPITAEGKSEAAKKVDEMEKWLGEVITNAGKAMNAIPMVAILIVFARLRAKVDLEGTNPPDYARKAFYGVAVFLYAIALVNTVFSCAGSTVKMFRQIIEALSRLGLYTCIVVIFYSIFNLAKTPAE